MASLRGEDTSNLARALALSTIVKDCIALGWLDQDLASPFERPRSRKRSAI